MKLHYLKHVPFEGLGSMESWLHQRGHTLSYSELYLDDTLPDVNGVDWLIVMGGPMGIHDDAQHPWLVREKQFIREAIDADKTVLGVCLGAQLIADVLSAKVAYQGHREIGWFPIDINPTSAFADCFPNPCEVFHWHGDRFDIPEGATPLASSEACPHQGFSLEDRVLALQFHCETTAHTAQDLITACADELDGTRYVQTAEEMTQEPQRFHTLNAVMERVLEKLERSTLERLT